MMRGWVTLDKCFMQLVDLATTQSVELQLHDKGVTLGNVCATYLVSANHSVTLQLHDEGPGYTRKYFAV